MKFGSILPFDFGYAHALFRRHWYFYVAIQFLIFIKVLAFYPVFGHGISYFGQPLAWDIPFAALPVFGNWIHVLDYFFHQAMHLSIALWVFLVAKHVKRIDIFSYALLFVLAAVLHNAGYWITAAHPNWNYSVLDFFIDYVSLWFFLAFFRFLMAVLPALRNVKIPFLESRMGN